MQNFVRVLPTLHFADRGPQTQTEAILPNHNQLRPLALVIYKVNSKKCSRKKAGANKNKNKPNKET
jgi:hypothetical protein